MNETSLTTILQGIAGEAIPPADVNLWPRIQSSMHTRPLATTQRLAILRLRWAAYGLLVLAALLMGLMLVGPDRALAALGRLIGYVPGVGFVNETQPLLAIPGPILQVREGITLTVEQAVADSERIVIVYRVEGLSIAAANSQGESAPTGSNPFLRLPDGETLDIVSGGGPGWGSGAEQRLVYPPLPSGVTTATFEIPRLVGMPPGAAPENWKVPLSFQRAPEGVTILPVEQVTDVPSEPSGSETPVPSEHPFGISLDLEKYVQVDDGLLVQGNLGWDRRFPADQGVTAGEMSLTDADGNEVPIEMVQPDVTGSTPYQSEWAFRTNTTSLKAPLSINLKTVGVRLSEPVTFSLDVGPTPKVGQTWTLNDPIEVLGLPVHAVSAKFVEQGVMQGLEVHFKSDPHLSSFELGLSGPDVKSTGGGSAGGGHPEGTDGAVSIALIEGKVSGRATLSIVDATVMGPWTVTWDAPANESAVQPSPTPQVCVDSAAWATARDAQSTNLPAGLGGHIAGYGPVNGSSGYVIYTANLDGSSLRVLGQGTWPSVSPDGTKTAFSAADGIDVANNTTGTVTHLPGTLEGDYSPRWSPNGSQIAFIRVNDLNLYVINAHGQNLKRVTFGPEYELLSGWSSGGTQLIYAVPSSDGQRMKSLDLASGTTTDLFTVGSKDVPDLSPDGSQMVYLDRVFGSPNYGLYVRSLDGSEPRVLAQVDGETISGGVWSPDGEWIVTSAYNSDEMFPIPQPVLINVGSCKVVRLPWFSGYVQGWGR